MGEYFQDKNAVTIIGGGLAGAEAAWQIVSRGYPAVLYEMRPECSTIAHQSANLAELVCSNSLRGAALTNAVGLLKEELSLMGSLIMSVAKKVQVPAGGALAVDREAFSLEITRILSNHPLLTIHRKEVREIVPSSLNSPVIIASGPLTSQALSQAIANTLGQSHLSFYDAISPIILGDSLNQEAMFRQSRYDKGSGDDYLNIPLSKEEYYQFVEAVKAGDKAVPHQINGEGSPSELRPFEGCMPIEDMIERGDDTLLFGPLKPKGLRDPRTGQRPFAVIQLRQDDSQERLWSMVGFQTKLKHSEQTRIFRTLPGLENAEFVRLGSVHRNSFINSPACLHPTSQFRNASQNPSHPALFFAGQITGVEGYVESTASGLVAGINALCLASNIAPVIFPKESATGSLLAYISNPERKDFQPMNISFGLMESYTNSFLTHSKRQLSKDERRLLTANHALEAIRELLPRLALGQG